MDGLSKKKEAKPKKGPWKAVGIVSTDAGDMAAKMERALNALEKEGYEARDPMKYGAHMLVYGRWPHLALEKD